MRSLKAFAIIFTVMLLFALTPAPCRAADGYLYADTELHRDSGLFAVQLYADRTVPLCGLEIRVSVPQLSPSFCVRAESLGDVKYACKLSEYSAHLIFYSYEPFPADGLIATLTFFCQDGNATEIPNLTLDCTAVIMRDGTLEYAELRVFLPVASESPPSDSGTSADESGKLESDSNAFVGETEGLTDKGSVTDIHPSATETEPLIIESEPPTVESEPPTVESEPPTVESEPSFESEDTDSGDGESEGSTDSESEGVIPDTDNGHPDDTGNCYPADSSSGIIAGSSSATYVHARRIVAARLLLILCTTLCILSFSLFLIFKRELCRRIF